MHGMGTYALLRGRMDDVVEGAVCMAVGPEYGVLRCATPCSTGCGQVVWMGGCNGQSVRRPAPCTEDDAVDVEFTLALAKWTWMLLCQRPPFAPANPLSANVGRLAN